MRREIWKPDPDRKLGDDRSGGVKVWELGGEEESG